MIVGMQTGQSRKAIPRVGGPRMPHRTEIDDVACAVPWRARVHRHMEAVSALRACRHAGGGPPCPGGSLVRAQEDADRIGRAASPLERGVEHLHAAGFRETGGAMAMMTLPKPAGAG